MAGLPGCLNQELVTDYRITRFFCGSNRERLNRDHSGSGFTPCSPVASVVGFLILLPELHGHARTGGHVRSGGGRLLAGEAAAHGFEFQAGILRGFDGAAHSLA